MPKYYLEYCGRAVSFTFSIYPYSWKRVTLTQRNKIYKFAETDTINAEAIRYYRSLAPQVRIKTIPQQPAAPVATNAVKQTPVIEQPTAKAEPKEEPKQEEPKKRGKKKKAQDEPVQKLPAEIVDTVSIVTETKEETPISDEIISDTIPSKETLMESVPAAPAMDEMELCEYLDMNYTEEAIRDMAKELEVEVARLRSKDSVITRLVNEKYSELLAKLGKA